MEMTPADEQHWLRVLLQAMQQNIDQWQGYRDALDARAVTYIELAQREELLSRAERDLVLGRLSTIPAERRPVWEEKLKQLVDEELEDHLRRYRRRLEARTAELAAHVAKHGEASTSDRS
jgi:hypothetical protein